MTAAKRELEEESGIDLSAEPDTNFVWLGQSSSGKTTFDMFARVYDGSATIPVQATNEPTHVDEMEDYDFPTKGFRGVAPPLVPAATGGGMVSTRHFWVELDQLINGYKSTRKVLSPTNTQIVYTPTVGAMADYTRNTRGIFEAIDRLMKNPVASYKPYFKPSTGPLKFLKPGSKSVTLTRGQLRAAQIFTGLTANDENIVMRVVIELVKALAALTEGTPAAAIAEDALDKLNALAGITPAAGPTSAPVPVEDWATGYFNDSELTPACKDAKFIGADCVPRAAYDIIWALNQHITSGQLDTAHAANLAEYDALDAEIKRLKAAGVSGDDFEKKQTEFDQQYRNVYIPVVDPSKPGPATRVMRVPNPYRSHAYRQTASFANPTPIDLSGNPNLQANINLLKATVTPEFIGDTAASKLLLEDLWFCAKNPGGPGCFMMDGLAQLEQYRVSKVQKDGAAHARAILKGDVGAWLKTLIQKATADD